MVGTANVELGDSLGVFWVVAFQIELAEVKDHHIARRLVRYAAATSKESSSYATAVAAASGEIVDAVAAEWVPASPPPDAEHRAAL